MFSSLLRQNIAVMTLTLIVAIFLTMGVFLNNIVRPQGERIAATAVQGFSALEMTLAMMEGVERQKILDALSDSEAHIFDYSTERPVGSGPPTSLRGMRFATVLEESGPHMPLIVVDHFGQTWIELRLNDGNLWIAIEDGQRQRPIPALLVSLFVVLGLALTGGALLQARVGRPLRRLQRQLTDTGADLTAGSFDETGPREVADVAGALNRMRAQLREVEAERALMLAGVSHDLRTPLTKIRLALALLHSNEVELTDSAVMQVSRIEGMLVQFLEYARGFKDEATQVTNIHALITHALEGCDADVTVELDVTEGLTAAVKEQAFMRAVINLVTNAHRYGAAPIMLSATISGADLIVEVSDAGQDLSPTKAEALTRPFARGNVARSGQGTGLGLAIVEQVVRAHGGTLKFARHEGRFVARLSLPQDETPLI